MAYVVLPLIALVLLAVLGYAARVDYKARKDGKVILPVKNGFMRRTTFISVTKEELAERKLQAVVDKHKADRERARGETGTISVGDVLGFKRRRDR